MPLLSRLPWYQGGRLKGIGEVQGDQRPSNLIEIPRFKYSPPLRKGFSRNWGKNAEKTLQYYILHARKQYFCGRGTGVGDIWYEVRGLWSFCMF